MPTRFAASHPPDAHDVRAELERIVAGRPFATSPKLMNFLRYVVESTLAGQGERLKGYTIGVEALGRGETFDPQIDPIVRVEAIRLRAALARYYSGEGSRDAVIIEMPRGRYVAHFRYRADAVGAVAAWNQAVRAVQAIGRFLMSRVTIQVQPAQIARDGFSAGKLAAPGARLLPTATTAPQALAPDGRQDQQAEGAPAARARRPRPGRDRRDPPHDRGDPRGV
jgi:hypothetical protein